MSRVARLPLTLANQIAAGEVVERPSSVAKELIENSLDAGASRIDIDVERGGAQLLRVRDDGAGIHGDDLPLALERHATSKISVFEDLERVATMGFRGEALPSIASVSRFELASCVAGADSGWVLRVEGGVVSAAAPSPHPVGTTVTVRDLFFNTPARRKFLRTEKTELRHIEEVVRRVALARFDVAITLRHDERVVWALPGAATEQARERRLARLCGREFVDAAVALDLAAEGLGLRGWLGGPGYSRAHADVQHFFVNARSVADNVARHAVRVAVADHVASGRHPAYVLFLELDPREVDVNVHPTKHEVRYREARLVHDFVHRSLQRELAEVSGTVEPAALHATADGHDSPLRAGAGYRPAPGRAGHAGTFAAYQALHPAVAEGPAPVRRQPAGPTAGPRTLAIGTRYLGVDRGHSLQVVDLARARRLWLASRVAEVAERPEVDSRPLLLPVSLRVDERVADRLEALVEVLATAGFDLRRVGPAAVSLRRTPVVLESVQPEALLGALAGLVESPAAARDPSSATLLGAVIDACDMVTQWVAGADDVRLMLAAMEAEPASDQALLDLDEAALDELFRRAAR